MGELDWRTANRNERLLDEPEDEIDRGAAPMAAMQQRLDELERRLAAPAEEVVVERGEVRDPRMELAPPGLTWRWMVRWFDPRNLLRSAKESFLSAVIGRYADQRQVVGHRSGKPKLFDYRQHQALDGDGGLWIDYVADAGDGWDSTYTVARGVGRAKLEVGDGEALPRATVLVFGGDEVYPIGAARTYDERLVAPYATAIRGDELADSDPHPDVYAIPGNHDWYDSLVAFSRKFLAGRWFAHWQTRQNRSYFALRLPGHWWLLGTDVQLGSDIDGEQLEYFEHVAQQMGERDRVILCNAEPHWIYDALADDGAPGGGKRDSYRLANLRDLETRVLQDRTWIYLAGDLHHYRRHTCEAAGRHKITAGGGGAFTHPTHTSLGALRRLPDPTPDPALREDRVYQLAEESCFPPPAASRRITLRNLLPFGLLWRQPLFFLAPALLYLLTCWIVPLQLAQDDRSRKSLSAILSTVGSHLLIESRGAALWTLLVVVGFIVLTPLPRWWARLAGGIVHALAHMAAVILCAWLAIRATPDFVSSESISYLWRGLLIFSLGGALGSLVFGLYLAVMCEVFGAHDNDAAATQGCRHWKSFLRLYVRGDGALAIHPIGIARTPRWTARGYQRDREERPLPADGREESELYQLIEPPIRIGPHGSRQVAPR